MEGERSARKAVDEAFRRMFDYEWGTHFDIDGPQANSNRNHELIRIFGSARAARIIGSRMINKKRNRATPVSLTLGHHKRILLPSIDITSQPSGTTTSGGMAGASTAKPASTQTKMRGVTKIDSVLAQLAGPAKTSTVKKTSDDWESFKETDKQLQDELEKQAQGKDAFLVKKDFLLRVDNRRFEIEKGEREKERTKKITMS